MDAIQIIPMAQPIPRGFWNRFADRFIRSNFEWRWLRTLITLCAFLTAGAFFGRDFHEWILPGIAVTGSLLCLYFGHILFFRLQCSLIELLALTTVFGLIDGLLLSTPGALKMGLYFSPAVAAWILHAAVSGIISATLSGVSGIRARLLYMVAAWLGGAALGLLILGAAIVAASQVQRMGVTAYLPWAWPMLGAGMIGMVLNIWLGIKTRRRAKLILQQP